MSAGPGWFPDPAGQPGRFRYWDGQRWSAATTDAPGFTPPPSATSAQPVAASTAAAGADQLTLGARTPRRRPGGWLLAMVAVLAAVAVAVVLVVRTLGGGDDPFSGPTPGGPGSQEVCPAAGAPTVEPPPAPGDRVVSGKLSFPKLGSPFAEPQWDTRVPFGSDVSSQDAMVERSSDGEVIWVASVLIARLLAGDGFYGPQQGAETVAGCVVGLFYGNAVVQRRDLTNEATKVDGRPAWLIESHLTFDIPTIQTKGETMIIVVVDVGDGEAGLFYASIPDTSPQFMQPARDSLEALRVE